MVLIAHGYREQYGAAYAKERTGAKKNVKQWQNDI